MFDCDEKLDVQCPPPPILITQRRLKTPSIADYFPRVSKTPVEMENSRIEDAWMCDEEDECLDTTLWDLEKQGIIPGTPVHKDRAENIATKPQDCTVLEEGGGDDEWEGGEEEDYWLSQTLHVQETRGADDKLPPCTGGATSPPGPQKPSPAFRDTEEDDWRSMEDDRNRDQEAKEEEDPFWSDPLSFLRSGSYPAPSQEDGKVSRLVTIETSQGEVGGNLVLYQETHPLLTLEEEAVGVAPMLTTTGQASVSRVNGAESVGPFDGVDTDVVEGQTTMDPHRCVKQTQESHSLDGGEYSEEGYSLKSSLYTEPSCGGEEKRMDDDQAQPHAHTVTTHTKLQQSQRAEIRNQRSASAKYYTSSPLPRAKEVTISTEKKKKKEMNVKSGTARNHQEDAPEDKKKSRKPSSLTPGRGRCVHAKGGICDIHGPGAKYTWRPIFIKETGPDGKTTMVKSKEWFYVCDISQDNKKLKQTKISFMKTTAIRKTTLSVKDNIPDNIIGNDGLQQGERFCDISTTNLEGTTTTLCEDRYEHHGETGDEK